MLSLALLLLPLALDADSRVAQAGLDRALAALHHLRDLTDLHFVVVVQDQRPALNLGQSRDDRTELFSLFAALCGDLGQHDLALKHVRQLVLRLVAVQIHRLAVAQEHQRLIGGDLHQPLLKALIVFQQIQLAINAEKGSLDNVLRVGFILQNTEGQYVDPIGVKLVELLISVVFSRAQIIYQIWRQLCHSSTPLFLITFIKMQGSR